MVILSWSSNMIKVEILNTLSSPDNSNGPRKKYREALCIMCVMTYMLLPQTGGVNIRLTVLQYESTNPIREKKKHRFLTWIFTNWTYSIRLTVILHWKRKIALYWKWWKTSDIRPVIIAKRKCLHSMTLWWHKPCSMRKLQKETCCVHLCHVKRHEKSPI